MPIILNLRDTFSSTSAASTGSLESEYLWSNPGNWSRGTPVSGGNVVLDGSGVDDLGSLSLTSVTEEPGAELFYVAGASLAIGTLAVDANGELYAGILGDATLATVSVASIVGSGSILGAVGGTFIDLSSSDPGEHYFAGYGGSVTLHAAPASGSILEFGGGYVDTIALETLPTGIQGATLEGLAVGDVLELPGAIVDAVSFGASSLTITTNLGSTTFANAGYDNSVTGYIATHNAASGLEAITLTGPDIFSGGYATTVGSIGVIQLWSNPYNWQSGATPVSGGSVVLDADGVDDLGSLSLTSVTEEPGAELFYVAGASLAIGTLAVDANGELYAGILGDATLATVSVASIVGSGSILGAVGGTFIDLSSSDPGEHYFAGYGGSVTLHAAPASGSILEFGGGYVDTIALETLPTGIQGATLEGLAVGDVLELPGAIVDAVSFGASSLTITTNLGSTTFSNASYGNSVTGYIATHNAANGLENITLTGPDVFSGGYATTVGSIGVIQLWSNPYNWQSGATPVSGGSVVLDADGVDDLGSLSLTSVTEEPGAELFYVAGASLAIGTLAVDANGELYAGILGDATLATVSVASIVGSGSILGAVGGTFIDLSSSDPGEHYFAGYGGSVTLHAAPASGSILEFGGGYVDTIALETLPTGIQGATLEGLAVGDVLELPGAIVDAVSFGASSLTITTNLGSTTFSNASYGNSVTGYIATHNAANGLENITFTGPDIFSGGYATTVGSIGVIQLWSNPYNWQSGATPVSGGSVVLDADGVDDLGSLSLTSVTEEPGAELFYVAGASLAIGTLAVDANGELYAGILGDATLATVSVASIVGSGSILGAVGGTFIDLSSSDPGEHYFAGYGGSVTLHAAPASGSILEFGGGYVDTIALETLPTGIQGATLEGLAVGDVLELPGAIVDAVSFGASSLTITTNLGSTTFANAGYDNSVTGYIATHNAASGLEAITLTGPDVFSGGYATTVGSIGVIQLWSNPYNWQSGATPVSGGSVVLDADGVDDLGSLSLTSVTEEPGAELFYVAGASLAIGTLAVDANGELYAGILGDATLATVSVASIVGSGSILGAVGGTFIDLSSSDPGEHYFAGYGGSVTLHAAPASGSILEFGGGYVDTIALETLPTGIQGATLEGLAVGDVLELPGAIVDAVSFGASSLTITTNLGSTTFANAGYDNSVTGYIATHNAASGLEAITLTGPDVFSGGYATTVGSIGVIQLWSNPYNWQSGATPVSGGSVVLDADGVDDLGSLSLTSVTEEPGAELFYVAGASLAIGTLAVDANGELYAGILGDATLATVSVASIVGSGSILGAVGGTFIDLSSSDPGEHYFAGYGGSVTLHAAPASGSILEFGGGYVDTIALETLPTGIQGATLEGLAVGDVLELPGAIVDAVSFGASSLTITTNLGSTTFANAGYDNSVTGYIATHNAASGLEAITLTGPDIFSGGYATTVGSIGVIQLWSNPYNWQSGATPVSGGSVVLDADGVDDLGSLSLTSVTEEPGAELFYVAGASLAIGTLAVDANGELYAGILGDATLATVSVASIVGSGSILGAVGGTFIDLSSSDPGEHYFAGYGGSVTLHAAPASGSILEFGGGYVDTIALETLPTGIQGATLEGLAVGDVLELPGAIVDAVSFGASSLTITTNLGSTTFSNASYGNSVTGYIATHNAANGLENITFTGPDIFSGGYATTVGSIGVIQLWSNPYNWQSGATPVSGGSVVLDADGVDDLGSLSLTSVTEEPGAELFYVAGASLAIGTLAVDANGELYAGILGDATLATVSVASIVGSGSILGAVGGTFIDLSSSDPGEHYFAGYGGSVTLHAAPASGSILEFGGGYVDTIALETLPTGIQGATLEGLAVGDVLELPGAIVDAVSFGASSLTITTNLGSTTFANAGYDNSVTGYIATHNAASGLEAITLTGPDVFSGGYATTVGSIGVIQLWSNPYNWQSGATPVSGGSVVLDADGVDDLGSLSLTSVTEEPGAELFYVAGASLAIGTLAVDANGELYAGILGDATLATVSVASIVGSGSILGAVGGTFIDLSSSDPGEHYFAGYGGSVTLHAAPASGSILEFGGGYVDTIALETLPTGIQGATLEGLAVGDVLELPGAIVDAVSFGASSLTITTNLGSTTFANAGYDNSVTGYIATHNAASGLEAITLTGPDIFSGGYATTVGSIGVIQLWSNPYNWQSGATPVSGGSVVLDADGVDDLGSLSLTSVTEEPGAELFYVAGASLAIGTLAVDANGELYAGILGDATLATVSVASIVGSGSILGAVGGTFIDLSSSDPGEHYFAGYGGSVTLHAAPASGSILEFGGGYVDTIALETLPTGIQGATLEGLAVGDVLELPGAIVDAVSFGASSLTITTNLGSTTFANAGYDNSVTGYIATHNAANGLENITLTGPDVFLDNVEGSSGALAGQYLWSNQYNWSAEATPVSGGSVVLDGTGADDIGSISLTSVTETGANYLHVAGSGLVIGTLDAASGFELYAGEAGFSTPITVTVDSIVGSGGLAGALDPNAAFIDLSSSDPGAEYYADYGGSVTLHAAPAASSTLEFGDVSGGTIALEGLAPGTYAATLGGLASGTHTDVLELPGTAVSSVSFGASSLTIVTNLGTFDFANAGYFSTLDPVTGYIATHNAASGLEAITLTGPDVFLDNVEGSSGALAGQYLWSNQYNWSAEATPVSGGSVVLDGTGADDIGSISLTSVTETGANYLHVAGSGLVIGTLDAASGFELYAGEAGFSTPITVTVDSIVGSGGLAGALDPNAAFIDLSSSDPGAEYYADYGGSVTLHAAPAASSTLEFGDVSGGTIALEGLAPGTYAATLGGLASGTHTDVLELPGTAVSSVSFGASSLTIVTNLGTTAFSDVVYEAGAPAPSGYMASADASSGLEAITFICFYPGTYLAAADGTIRVEDVTPGTMLKTFSGNLKPVRWLGRSDVSTRFADPLQALPIRIKAGALGETMPERDLLVSPCHALFVGGILIQAGALVNGTTILRERQVPERFSYYHVELATHELLIAEGTPAESFIDNVDRMHFSNWAERGTVTEPEPIEEMPYPRAKSHRQVPFKTRRLIEDRAGRMAHAKAV